MPRSSRPDPESNYLSKYLVDFNKRELEKFFHPKTQQAVFSVAALGMLFFFAITWLAPLKDTLLNKQYPKNPASAEDEQTSEHITLTGPQTIQKGQQLSVLVTVRTDRKKATDLSGVISYPKKFMVLQSVTPVDNQFLIDQTIDQQLGTLRFKEKFPDNWQTAGSDLTLLRLNFKTLQAGEVSVNFDEAHLKNNQEEIKIFTTNYPFQILE